MPQDPKVLRRAKLDMAISLLACGVDVERSVLFEQSKVKEHAELQWIFNCITPVGWLSRMTQWKSKLGANTLPSHSHSLSDETLTSGLKMGLLDYPVLQAADILLYKATHVPIGEDQLQHLELARDIGSTFNKTFKTKLFPLPEGIVPATTKRIMSLRNPSAKMSKSDPSDQSRINLTDTADMIKSKLARAQTDSIRGITYDPVNRPGVSNLLSIQAELEGRTIEQVVDDSKSISSNKEFKDRVTEVVIESLLPIQAEIKRLENDLGYVQNVLDQGAHRARSVATVHLDECYKLIGLK
ncbi:Tryptophan--tRNA ligase, mitochondrial [Umbelopsis sp. WA50703]